MIIKAKAIKSLKNNANEVIGYKLQDESGKVMSVASEAIIEAINKNSIFVENLEIRGNRLIAISKKRAEQRVKENSKIERMLYLIDLLNKARYAYEQQDTEIMSNYEYDKLYDELDALETETQTIMNNSPTINVGYEVMSKLPKKSHSKPMLSLGKTKDISELRGFLGNKQGVLSWKLDGLTVVLEYNNGELVEAITRGNGEVGEVVTSNARVFVNLPRKIAYKGRMVLRGEATISYKDFEEINSRLSIGEEPYKNPRNLCSGSVRQLDSSITAQRNVNWTCFSIEEIDSDSGISDNIDEQLEYIKSLGFDIVEYEIVNEATLESSIMAFESKITSGEMGKPSDGLVLTYRSKSYGESLGRTSKTPKHSKAFKWEDEEAITKVTGVEWSVGKSGVITPVIEFEPTDIEGSTVTRASSHNVSIFNDMQFGIGDSVKVFKANMIIPQISENLTRSGTCRIPDTCPCCGYSTAIKEDPKSGILTLWCMNDNCEAKGNRLFKHFVSRDAMNIDGVSSATLETLSENGIITDLPSIFHVVEHRNEIVNMEGYGERSFMNMVTAIEKAREVKLANLIYALAIPNIGLATAKLICKHFNFDVGNVISATYEELTRIEGIGDVIAESFTDYFNTESNLEQFIRLVKEVNIVKEEISDDTSMQGVTICVTGDVYIFKNRRQVKDIVESMGGKLTGSVSRSTTYLVTNDTESGSRKNQAAKQYGIEILTEQQFINKFNIQV